MNHRKRKADNDDHRQDTSSSVLPDTTLSDSTPIANAGPSNAPRQPWITSETDNSLWTSPTSPQVSSPLSSQVLLDDYPTKRPRLEKLDLPTRNGTRRLPRIRTGSRSAPYRLPMGRHGSDIEDIGIVSTADPGPSSGSLLRVRTASSSESCKHHFRPIIPIDPNSIHIPPRQPLINRHTLKELDLEAILRNPQLRHDLLFDPGLQFRPTCSRRKRDLAEKYWTAVMREVQTGCTCVTFDSQGNPHRLVCVCAQTSTSSKHPVFSQLSAKVYTLRMPSRILTLLCEFLEVLLLVIQPLSKISGIYVNPNTFKAQMQEHTAQAAYIRSIFDPVLIEQELKRGLFDPSGLFRAIGTTLKGHCAPMRDSAVESMVQAAHTCFENGNSGTNAVKALRMCMEILELMKLDIANHQLQTLRPFLIRTSGQFELKTLKNRHGGDYSIRVTQEWLHAAHTAMVTRDQPISHPLYPPGYLKPSALSGNQQLYLATLKGIVDLVFDSPLSNSTSATPTNTPLCSPITAPTPPQLTSFPETLYLDASRIQLLSSDAIDATALYMFLLLYRQLIFSESTDSAASDPPKVNDSDIARLKREIRDIGTTRLGCCFTRQALDPLETKVGNKEAERWRIVKQDIVLQVAKRANDARNRTALSTSAPSSPIGDAPDERVLNVAQCWAESNMQEGSSLSTMLHNRLRDVVFTAVVALAYPCRNSATGKTILTADFLSSLSPKSAEGASAGMVSGMEPLADEIRLLSEKISRLALIHLNAYLPLYEKKAFLSQ